MRRECPNTPIGIDISRAPQQRERPCRFSGCQTISHIERRRTPTAIVVAATAPVIDAGNRYQEFEGRRSEHPAAYPFEEEPVVVVVVCTSSGHSQRSEPSPAASLDTHTISSS